MPCKTPLRTHTHTLKRITLTHSSSQGSAGFPSGCCRLKPWPSGRCQSESLAGGWKMLKGEMGWGCNKAWFQPCSHTDTSWCIQSTGTKHDNLVPWITRSPWILGAIRLNTARSLEIILCWVGLLPWRWSLRCFSGTVWWDIWPCPTETVWCRWQGPLKKNT